MARSGRDDTLASYRRDAWIWQYGGGVMPASTEKQRRLMGADLARKREGKKTKTGMTEKQLREFAKKKK